MRSYDIDNFCGKIFYTVRLTEELTVSNPEYEYRLKELDDCCQGDYLILLTTILFKCETDAAFFTLKYSKGRQQNDHQY